VPAANGQEKRVRMASDFRSVPPTRMQQSTAVFTAGPADLRVTP
jgi:hypothetical protein